MVSIPENRTLLFGGQKTTFDPDDLDPAKSHSTRTPKSRYLLFLVKPQIIIQKPTP